MCFFCFYRHDVPLLLTSSFLSSYRPACSSSRRDDFFLPWLGHSIFELAITARFVSPYPRRSHLPVRASCGFWRFHMGPPAPCLLAPSPPHASSVLPLLGTPLVMSSSHRFAHRLALRSHRPSPRFSTRRAGRGCLLPMRRLSCPHAVI